MSVWILQSLADATRYARGYMGIIQILNLLNDALAIWAEIDPDAYSGIRACKILSSIDDKLEHLTDEDTGKLWLT